MAEAFDPYYIWLGIPPEEQPADHYRLLGIRRFEPNLDVIGNAADQRVRHIRSMQTGKRQAESQRLLNEIAVASGTLLDPDQRSVYDANLRSRPAAVQLTPQSVPIPATLPLATASTSVGIPAPLPTIQSNVSATPRRAVTLSSRPKNPQVKLLLVGAAIVAAIAAVVVVALILRSPGSRGPTAGATRPHPENLPPGSRPGGVLPDTSQKDLSPGPPAPVAAQVPPTTSPPSVPPPTPPPDPEAFIPLTELQGAQTSVWIRKFGYFPWQGTLLKRDGKSESFVPGSVPSEETTFELGGMGVVTLEFEHVCPPAYLLQIRATRLSGSGELAIDVVGDRNPTCVMIDRPAKGTFRSGMEISAETPLSEQEDKWHFVEGQLAKTGEPVTITIAVERIHALFAQVATSAATTPVARVAGINATSMTPRSGERAVAPNRIGLTTRDSRFRIHQALIVPLVSAQQSAALAAARKGEMASKAVVTASPAQDVQPGDSSAHRKNWEYGYGRVDGSGRVVDFRPLVYSVMTEPDGTKSVLWGTQLVYSDMSPMSWMCLRRDGGVPGIDSQLVVVRRWRCPELAFVAVKGEVQHASMQGDGIRAYLVTGKGRKVWSAAVMNTKAAISAEEFLLPPNETLNFCVDCNGNQAFDHFKSHLVLDVRYTRRGREPKTDRWDSIADYRDPPPTASGSLQVQKEGGKATARFVRIELPGKARILNLAEVQVYSGSENVAVKGNATQSSTGYDGSAKLANDGNTNGQYRDSKSVSHTNLEDNPWWEVDLGAEKVLDKIVVWNRTDGGTDPWLQGYKVLALDASRNVVWQVSPPEYPKPSSEFAPSGISGGTPAKDPVKLTRFSIPDDVALTTARATLKETFGDLSQKSKKPDEKLKLSAELRGVADSEKDPAIRYALLDAARRLAMSGQDVRAALLVAGEIARQYETDPLDQQLETLKLTTGATMPASAGGEAVRAAMALAESGRDAGKIDVADEASLLAVELAAKGKNLDLRKQAKQVREVVQAYRKSAALVQEAEETLRRMPDDPGGNLVVGKWHCFDLGDWAKGLPYLEKCGEPALAAAAKAERDSKNILAIADAWYLAAEKLPRNERKPMQMRAQEFYALAAKELKGLEQLRAAKREEELKDAVGRKPSEGARPGSVPPQDEKLEPGLIIRIVSGSQAIPTPILGTSMNWDGIVWDNVEVESRKVLELRGISASPLATGYIELDTDDTVVFTLRNAYCLIDGTNFPPLVAAQKGEEPSYFGGRVEAKFEKQLIKGRHTLVIGRIPINTGSGTEFRVKRKEGGDCVFHSPKALEAELAKTVRLPGGGVSKGILLFGNLKFSR